MYKEISTVHPISLQMRTPSLIFKDVYNRIRYTPEVVIDSIIQHLNITLVDLRVGVSASEHVNKPLCQ